MAEPFIYCLAWQTDLVSITASIKNTVEPGYNDIALCNTSYITSDFCGTNYSITPIIRMLVVRVTNYPDRLGPLGNFVENCAKLISLKITGYWIQYSTVKYYGCLEVQTRRGRKV
jgi:hypothetical protein